MTPSPDPGLASRLRGARWQGVATVIIAMAGLGAAPAVLAAPPAGWSDCDLGDIKVEAGFPGARASACHRQAADHLALLVMPEHSGVNPSPWFAFRISSDRSRRVAATLVYGERSHRYWPKVSDDGKHWRRLPENMIRIADDGATATLTLDIGPAPLWVAAQELWTDERYDDWLESVTGRGGAVVSVLGWSGQRRPIHVLRAGAEPAGAGTVVLVGRQHPPEVPGAFAFERFVETLLDGSALSQDFRGRFGIVAVPNLNPDGVALGHWRENAGGMDINRDWGLFTQPETRLMRDLLAAIDHDESTRLSVFLDFHATREDVFYTQRDEDPVHPPFFERRWLGCLQELMPDYPVNRKPGHQATLPTAKTWVYRAYGNPVVTFEIGDETPRGLVAELAEQAAIAMMKTLLEEAPNEGRNSRCGATAGR